MELIISTFDVVFQLVTKSILQTSNIRPLVELVFWIADPFDAKISSTIASDVSSYKRTDPLIPIFVIQNPVMDIFGLS